MREMQASFSDDITLDARAGQVSAELARLGIAAETRVHVRVRILPPDTDALPMAALAEEGRAFDWLAEEPDLYSDADLLPARAG